MNQASPLWSRLFETPPDWQPVVLAVLTAATIAYLAARLTRQLATRLLYTVLDDTVARSSPVVRGPLRLIGAAVFLLVFGLVIAPVLELAGLRLRAGVRLELVAAWAFDSGLRILLIGVLAYAVARTVALLVSRFESEVNRGVGLDALERAKRARTLGSLIRNVASAVVGVIALLMVLRELGIDIAPVLAGAGVIGLAVGFGAQTLVRDIISGFFLILEDQVRVGDVAAINGQGGLVEAINLRTISLRDFEGVVHVFPNGAINTLANRSKDFSFYVIDLGVAYHEDPDRVMAALRAVGEDLQADDRFRPHILAPLEVVGVDAFADSSVQIKMRIKTMPLKQWEVGRELRRRILKSFAAHAIEIPFPQRVVTTVSSNRRAEVDEPHPRGVE